MQLNKKILREIQRPFPAVLFLTNSTSTIGLIFIAWFIFIGPGVAELTNFIFPLLKPDVLPEVKTVLSQNIKGIYVAGMHNYWFNLTGKYYFAGMYAAVLPMIPGIYAIYTIKA